VRFKFCEQRRALMKLVINNQVKIESKLFRFFFKFSNDVIHYTDDYMSTYTSYKLLEAIKKEKKEIEKEKVVNNIIADAKTPEAKEFVCNFFISLIYALDSKFIFYYFIYYSLIEAKFSQKSVDLLKKLVFTPLLKSVKSEKIIFIRYINDLKQKEALAINHCNYSIF